MPLKKTWPLLPLLWFRAQRARRSMLLPRRSTHPPSRAPPEHRKPYAPRLRLPKPPLQPLVPLKPAIDTPPPPPPPRAFFVPSLAQPSLQLFLLRHVLRMRYWSCSRGAWIPSLSCKYGGGGFPKSGVRSTYPFRGLLQGIRFYFGRKKGSLYFGKCPCTCT